MGAACCCLLNNEVIFTPTYFYQSYIAVFILLMYKLNTILLCGTKLAKQEPQEIEIFMRFPAVLNVFVCCPVILAHL